MAEYTIIEGWVNDNGFDPRKENITFITERFPSINKPIASLLLISKDGSTPEVVAKEEAAMYIKTAWVLAVQGKTKHEVEAHFKERYGFTL